MRETLEEKTKRLLTEIRRRIRAIKKASVGDVEAAHGFEDDLLEDTLKAIADGDVDSVALAQAALKVKKLKFARHTA